MKGNFGLKLIFGLMGLIYTIVGVVCLTIAVRWAGDVRRIFRLPEDDLALSILGIVFTVLGAAFLIVTLILILLGRRRARMREELLTWGTRVKAEVVDVRIDHAIRVNNHSPLIAQVRCSFPGGEVTLRSQRLWKACPNTGDMVEVVYDPMNEKRYVIEFPEEN